MLTKFRSNKGMVWGAISFIYIGLLLYTGYYTFLSNNEFATDDHKFKIVLGNLGFNHAEKMDIANHISIFLKQLDQDENDDIQIDDLVQFQQLLMQITGKHNDEDVIAEINQLFKNTANTDDKEAKSDAIIWLYMELQKNRDFKNEALKNTLWITDNDGETQIHLLDLKNQYAHELVKREAESFNSINSLATQSFTIVLGALLGFLSASLTDAQHSNQEK